jgi:hypothetical protein
MATGEMAGDWSALQGQAFCRPPRDPPPAPGNKAVQFVTADFPYQGFSGRTVMEVTKEVRDDVISCHGFSLTLFERHTGEVETRNF